MSIGAERRLGHPPRHVDQFVAIAIILGRRDRQRDRLSAWLAEVERIERIPDVEDRGLAVGGQIEVLHIAAGKPGQTFRLRLALGRVHAVEVDGAEFAIGKIDDRAIAGPTGVAVVAQPVCQLREAAVTAVIQPNVHAVRTTIVAAFPAPRTSAARERNPRPVGTYRRVRTKSIVHAQQIAAVQPHQVRPRAAIDIGFEKGGKGHDRFTVLVRAKPGEMTSAIGVGELTKVGSVRIHQPEIEMTVASRIKGDRRPARTPRGSEIVLLMTGQPQRGSSAGAHLPQIAAPRENNRRTLGADGRVTRQIDVTARDRILRPHRRSGKQGQRKPQRSRKPENERVHGA